ncbi:MAG TPA: InlB B-repeat-containing protein, partial [Bacilli bacterium]|nr:InlB B-repeat-containing protein [Bacilli bacterium]
MKKAKLILLVLIASLSFGFTTNVRAEEILEGEETKFNVVFKSDEKELKTISITENDSVTKIADPVQAGYTFLGWKLNDTFYDFTLPVTSDIELVASWQVNPETMPNRYTVSFSADDDIISIVEVEENESVEAIDNPTKAGYNFVSWQLDGSDYDFTSAVTSDITLVATWEMNGKYVVTFVSDGVTLSEVEVESGGKVSAITETTKDGYTFKGWLLEEETYDFDTLVTSNITLNASWEANPGEIYIDKNAEVDEDGDGRDVEVNLEVEGNPYTEATSTDIIIVLDNSSSMRNHIDEDDASTEIRMTATKAAAIALVNKLFPDGVVTTNVRVGIVRYGTNTSSFTQLALTNNKATIINFINDIAVPTGQGTNVDAGLTKATEEINEITTSSNKYVILLSDGIPTYFTDSEGTVRGRGNADSGLCHIYEKNIWGGGWKWYESWSQGSQNYDTKTKCEAAGGTWHTPSSEALEVATGLKDLATIFTISFATERTQFMKDVATPAEGDDVYANSFEASSAEELNQKFDEIFNRISIVATNVVVTDIIPDTFDLDETDFIGRHGAATVIDETTTKYGEDFIVEKLEDGTTKITWDLGSYDINRDYVLTYMVRAKAPYYGSMYTNVKATLTGTATDANPFYSDSKKINLVFNMPYVPVTSVTNNDGYGADTSQDDAYTVDRGKTLVIDADNGILNNDYINEENAQQSDPENVVTVEDEIIVVNNSLTHGTILINEDGSFTYIADDSHYGTASFEYFIRTKVTENGKTIYLDSNISTVTFNILGYGTLTVKHVYEGTNGTYENIVTPLNSEKLIGTTYTTSDLTDSKWHLVTTPSNAEGTYTNGNIVVTYVYEKVMGTLDVRHVWMNGDVEVLIEAEPRQTAQLGTTYTTSDLTDSKWHLVT